MWTSVKPKVTESPNSPAPCLFFVNSASEPEDTYLFASSGSLGVIDLTGKYSVGSSQKASVWVAPAELYFIRSRRGKNTET